MQHDHDEDGDRIVLTDEDREHMLQEIADIEAELASAGAPNDELFRRRRHLVDELVNGRRLPIDEETVDDEMSEVESQPDPDLVQVINRAGHIENLLNQIITAYCAPRKHAWYFMWSVVLDTSIMSLGAKQKVVMAIANELRVKVPKEALMQVVQLRNSFAHNTTTAHPVMTVGKTDEEHSSHFELHTLDSNGVLKVLKRHDALDKFNKNYRIAKVELMTLLDAIKIQLAEHEAFMKESTKQAAQ